MCTEFPPLGMGPKPEPHLDLLQVSDAAHFGSPQSSQVVLMISAMLKKLRCKAQQLSCEMTALKVGASGSGCTLIICHGELQSVQ